ncbi:MAG: hypothetical protein AAF409_09420 [Pseudomonadota bacterium]
MGLSRAAIAWMIEEAQRRPFEGSLLTFGVQNVFMDEAGFESLAHKMGFQLRPPVPSVQKTLIEGTVTSEHVFTRLGFDRVVTTDVDSFEGCDFMFDLNADGVPAEHLGLYDMVLDAGTFEHVFHLPNAFRNAVEFTKVGGRIVHQAPSSNHIDHGFHMFSPTQFWDFYSANRLELPRFDLFRYEGTADDGSPWDFGAYSPGSLNKKSFGGLGGGCFGIALVAEKVTETDGRIVPQQSTYAAAWTAKTSPGLQKMAPARPGLLKRIGAALRKLLPVEGRIRWKSVSRRFPLEVRRRF